MAGLRLAPGTDLVWNSGFGSNTTADGSNTFGTPTGGAGFANPALGTWHNIVVTVAPAPFYNTGSIPDTGSLWSTYMDGKYLGTAQSEYIIPGSPGEMGMSGLLYTQYLVNGSPALAAYESYPLTIGGIAQTIYGGMPVCGSNTTMQDVGIFNNNLDGGITANGSGGFTPNNIGMIDAIYNFGISSLNYNLGEVNQLFTVYANRTGTATVNGLNWTYATGLSGGLGVVEQVGGDYYVQLDSSGGGVEGVVPEPSTFALLLVGAACLVVFARRRHA